MLKRLETYTTHTLTSCQKLIWWELACHKLNDYLAMVEMVDIWSLTLFLFFSGSMELYAVAPLKHSVQSDTPAP